MYNLLTTFFTDFLYTVALFVISALIAIGGKVVYQSIKDKFTPPAPVVKKPPKSASKKSGAKTISINPDDFDKIYFKKSS